MFFLIFQEILKLKKKGTNVFYQKCIFFVYAKKLYSYLFYHLITKALKITFSETCFIFYIILHRQGTWGLNQFFTSSLFILFVCVLLIHSLNQIRQELLSTLIRSHSAHRGSTKWRKQIHTHRCSHTRL